MRYKQLHKQTTGIKVKSLGINTYVDQNRVNHLLKLFWHFNNSIISGDKCMFVIELFIIYPFTNADSSIKKKNLYEGDIDYFFNRFRF